MRLPGRFCAGSTRRGAPPPERELGALFNVSRLIARQALHRLREMGLVAGGQGGQNTVLDPDDANDPRIVALQMELAPEQHDEQDVNERQMLGGAMLLELAQLRMTDEQVAELDAMVTAREAEGAEGGSLDDFERDFWCFIATCARNKILLREARWWFEMLTRQPERRQRFYDRPELRLAVYRAVVTNLQQDKQKAAERFLTAVRTVWAARDL